MQLLAMHICIASILENIARQPSYRVIYMETRVICMETTVKSVKNETVIQD